MRIPRIPLCFCIDPREGAKALGLASAMMGLWHLIIILVALESQIMTTYMSIYLKDGIDITPYKAGVIVILVLIILCGMCLVIGAAKKWKYLLLPWILFCPLLVAGSIYAVVYISTSFKDYQMQDLILPLMAAPIIFIICAFYWWLVVIGLFISMFQDSKSSKVHISSVV